MRAKNTPKPEYQSNRHVVYSCKYHIVWCPKFRRSVLVNGVDKRLKEIIQQTAAEFDATVIELEIMPDHVHLLCEVDPQFGVHRLVRYLKGRSSRLLRQEFPWLRSRLPTLWTHSYFVSTVGGAPLSIIKLEKLSYRAFQKMFGKSVGFRGPGTFVALLRRKAANAGAEVDEFSTRTTRLSQICLCGTIAKKPLSERWHVCDCGVGPIQRDLFSAWLARFVVNDKLDVGQAQAAWPGADSLLRAASCEIQPAMGQGQPKPNLVLAQVCQGQSRSSVPSGECLSEACHGAPSAVTRKLAIQPEPPRFSGGE